MNLKEHFTFVHPYWYYSARKMSDSILKRSNPSVIKRELLLCSKEWKERFTIYWKTKYLVCKVDSAMEKSEESKVKHTNTKSEG